MSITNIGNESSLTPHRRREAIAKLSRPTSTYLDFLYEEALNVLNGEDVE